MTELHLYAITPAGPQPLPTPPGATEFLDLYEGLTLGVYTVLRTFAHNKFLHLADHLARTQQSMDLLGWQETLDLQAIRQALHTLCTAAPHPETRVRIDVLPAPAYALGTESRLLIALMPFTPLPAHCYQNGVAVGFAQGLVRANPRIKQADFAAARKRAQPANSSFFERLMLNQAGQILEGVSSNFYGFRRGMLYTADEGVLEGITRRIILTLAREAGIEICLEAIHADEVAQLDEAAISSSSRGILPVVAIDHQPIGNGYPGPRTCQLMMAYEDYVARTIKTALEE
jgi:branched-chain amino acid aminotransferase